MLPDTLIRAPRGSERREVPLNEVAVPDLYKIGEYLEFDHNRKGKRLSEANAKLIAEQVYECWHLCLDLLENIRNPNC